MISEERRPAEGVKSLMRKSSKKAMGDDGQPKKVRPRQPLARKQLEWLTTVAHELRGPASALILYTELLEEELNSALNPGQRELISNIRLAGELLIKRIDGLLAGPR